MPGGFAEEPFDERAEVPPEQAHQLTHHLHPCQQFVLFKKKSLCISVGPPGSGSGSQQEKIIRKSLIPTVL